MKKESNKASVERILKTVVQKEGFFWDGGRGECIYCGIQNTVGFKHYKGCVVEEIKEYLKGR